MPPYGGWELDGEPYTTKDKTEFTGSVRVCWVAVPITGAVYRYVWVPEDFKPKDGLTDPWPITYADVKPYYDKVDRMIGIYGTVENIESEPDGIFLTAAKTAVK
jgi:hypothetical protein